MRHARFKIKPKGENLPKTAPFRILPNVVYLVDLGEAVGVQLGLNEIPNYTFDLDMTFEEADKELNDAMGVAIIHSTKQYSDIEMSL